MSTEDLVGPGKVVSIDYVLTDPSGAVVDRSEDGRPLVYLHGAHNIVEGLEAALDGKRPGDELQVTVPPEKGYGIRRNIKPQKILRSKFPDDVKVEKGSRFTTAGPEGRPIPIWVTKVMGREVHVTPEHPLAGVTLSFAVTVRDVREATEEERAHGHPHGPGGAHE